jgi:DNA-binding CsgD family transcriptional regulator
VRQAQTATAIYRQLGRPQFAEFSLTYLATALALSGRAPEAEQALRARDELDIPPSHFMGVDPDIARGWVAVAAGNGREAHEVFLAAAAKGESIGDNVGALAALHSLARVGESSRAAGRIHEIAARVEGKLASARVAHVDALVDSDAVALDAVSAEFERMGASLLAAESAADAAAAWVRRGEKRAAAASERRSMVAGASCSGAQTPALESAKSRAWLTASERDAAHRAAAGKSNKEIADELVISVRTVENRLQSVYSKLGVSGRHELGQALGWL